MPVQRWRLTFARTPDAPDQTQREQVAAWEATLEAAGLRVEGAGEQPKLMLALPAQTGLTADSELADLLLPTRRAAAQGPTRPQHLTWGCGSLRAERGGVARDERRGSGTPTLLLPSPFPCHTSHISGVPVRSTLSYLPRAV